MMNNKLVVGILALSGASAVKIAGPETTTYTRDQFNRWAGNVKNVQQPEKETFHLDNILEDWYNQFEHLSNRGNIDYTVPKPRYPDPKR